MKLNLNIVPIVLSFILTIKSLYPEIQPEPVTVGELPPPHSKTVYMVDPIFPHVIKTKIYIIDGREGKLQGMLDAGLTANIMVSHDQKFMYVFNTFYSKLVRGERSDYLTIYDMKTLNPIEDIPIPSKRMLSIPKMNSMGLSLNKEIMYYMNLTPATGVGFIDLKNRKHIGEISVPNCNQIFPHGEFEFTMICSNGSLLTLDVKDLNDVKRSQTKPFFDVVNDPVFEHSAFDRKNGIVYFLSYDGLVYKTTLGSEPKIEKPWSIVSEQDKKQGWRPGGWQVADIHYDTGMMYVIMHRGPKWSHKIPGDEIWVFDVKTQKRVQRIKTKIHAYSLRISQDKNPYLYTTTPEGGSLSIYNATNGKLIRVLEDVGTTPHTLVVGGGN